MDNQIAEVINRMNQKQATLKEELKSLLNELENSKKALEIIELKRENVVLRLREIEKRCEFIKDEIAYLDTLRTKLESEEPKQQAFMNAGFGEQFRQRFKSKSNNDANDTEGQPDSLDDR